METIYLDNCATTQVSKEICDKVIELMSINYGNPSSLHGMGSNALHELSQARFYLAQVLACNTDNVFFTSGGTESNNLAIIGGAHFNKKYGSKIITTEIEHSSVLKAFEALEVEGYITQYAKPNKNKHYYESKSIIDLVDENTILVSFMLVNNETGEILPAKKIIKGIRKKNPNTLIHMDCVQAFGKIDTHIFNFDVDFLSASSHKIHGPKGSGLLYVKDISRLNPRQFGGEQESRIRPGTENVPCCCGFGLAAHKAMEHIKKNYEYVDDLKNYLVEKLEKIENVTINSIGENLPYILNFSLIGYNSDDLVAFMTKNNVCISASSACMVGARSYVLEALGFDENIILSTVRVSFSNNNNKAEIDRFVLLLDEFIAK